MVMHTNKMMRTSIRETGSLNRSNGFRMKSIKASCSFVSASKWHKWAWATDWKHENVSAIRIAVENMQQTSQQS